MAKKLTKEEKQARKKKREDKKCRDWSNATKARILDAILCLNTDEFVVDVCTSVGVEGKLCTEVLIRRELKVYPYFEKYEVKFEHNRKKLDD